MSACRDPHQYAQHLGRADIAPVVVELGPITPPVGLNVFIINSLAPDLPMRETFKGVIPFFLSEMVRVTLLVLFPAISLALPHLLG